MDMGRLDFDELLELRELQAKMQDVTAAKVRHRRHELEPEEPEDLARLTLNELVRLDLLFLKMANEPYPYERVATYVDADGILRYRDNDDLYTWEKRTYCPYCGHVLASGAATYKNDSVPGVFCSEQCLESMQAYYQTRGHRTPSMNPPAVAPAPAPAAPATPAPATAAADKPHKRPADDVMTATHLLDGLMRFGA